jgi:hypothetical protein
MTTRARPILLALLACNGWGAISVVNSTSGQSATGSGQTATSVSATFSGATSASNVVILGLYVGANSKTFTWPSGFTAIYTQNQTVDGHETAMAWGPGGSTTYTVSWTGAICCNALFAFEVSGVSTTDGQHLSGSTSSGTTQTSGSLTTTNASDILFGLIGYSGANATATGESGWTYALLTTNAGSVLTNSGMEYKIVSATGTYAATSTTSASEAYDAGMVAFEASGGAPPPAAACTRTLLGAGPC